MYWDDDKYFKFESILNIPILTAVSVGNNFQASGSGTPGQDGLTPYIKDGNWWIGDTDTGVKAEGIDGKDGTNGIDGVNGKDGTNGADGTDGKSAYDIAVENGFIGTEQQWLDSLRGKDGTNGIDGEDGKSAYQIAVDNGFVGTETEWLASLKGKDGLNGKDGLAPIVYHADLSKVGNQIEFWVDSIRCQYIYNTADSISFNVKAGLSGNVIVDLKRSSQYDGVAAEGSTLDNFTLTTTYQNVDTIVYNSSREMHRTWIRTQDPTTGLWNLYFIDLCVSNKGARTDIIVYPIYTNAAIFT